MNCEIFVGIFTCDKRICQETHTKVLCIPKSRSNQYTTSNWVVQESGLFQIECKKRTEEVSYWTGKPTKWTKEEMINIKGAIKNLSGRYTIEVSDEKGTTLLTRGNVYKASGFMMINKNCDFIEIMEKTSDGKTKFEQWKKNK
jgi:hypothetical protein